jgi:hypothetical protein
LDWYQLGSLLVALVAAGGGGKAWFDTRKAKKAGMPADEQTARATAPAAEWLTDHYRQEVEVMRADLRSELTQTRQELKDEQTAHAATRLAADVQLETMREQLHAANATIAKMERHIWLRKPPPPPNRS